MEVEMMTCPICGQKFPANEYECLDNGNPACPHCVKEEQNKQQNK